MPAPVTLPTHRRITLAEFLAYTGWSGPGNPAYMQVALDYFQGAIPAAVLRARVGDPGPWAVPKGGAIKLTQLMQAIDFTRPVSIATVSKNQRFKAFHTRSSTWQGNWYTYLSTSQDQVALPPNQESAQVYVAACSFQCLKSTVADAYVDWTRNRSDPGSRDNPVYRHGGGCQFFVWDAARYLKPIRSVT